ncbi:hypothetical protein C0993_010540, partial [Termitomyces sp. T159_Od127]
MSANPLLHRYPTRNRAPTVLEPETSPGPGTEVCESVGTTHGDAPGGNGEPKVRNCHGQEEPQPALEEPGPPMGQPSGELLENKAERAVRYSRRRSASESDASRLENEIGHSLLPDPPERRTKETGDLANLNKELSREQARAVAQARDNMTRDERLRVDNRVKKVNSHTNETGRGNNNDLARLNKGKGADPGNWGAAQLSEEDVDLEIQAGLLSEYRNRQHGNETEDQGDSDVPHHGTTKPQKYEPNKPKKRAHRSPEFDDKIKSILDHQ